MALQQQRLPSRPATPPQIAKRLVYCTRYSGAPTGRDGFAFLTIRFGGLMQRLGKKVGRGELGGLACVYTALIGGYEKLNEQPIAVDSRLPFICLTNDPELQSETWQIRLVEPLFGLDPIRSQRALKLLPHEYLSEFDCSIYIDNSVVLKTSPEALIEKYLGASAFCLPEHSFRNTVVDEFLEVEALGYDDQGRLFEQLNHYALEFPKVLEEKPFWTAVLLRDQSEPEPAYNARHLAGPRSAVFASRSTLGQCCVKARWTNAECASHRQLRIVVSHLAKRGQHST